MVAGLALGRFMKSSAARREPPASVQPVPGGAKDDAPGQTLEGLGVRSRQDRDAVPQGDSARACRDLGKIGDGNRIASIAAGSILALAALLVLLQALVVAIAEAGVPPAVAALIVGAVVALIAYLLVLGHP